MKLVALLTVLIACCVSAFPQKTEDVELNARADAIANEILSRPVAGISIAVARDGKVVFARGYGTSNLEHSVPVTTETVFHIDSVSKNILAAVVLHLVDEGKIDLDADVTKYVREAPTQSRRVTVRQLLSHTSGIYNFTSLPDADTNERLDLTQEQVLALFKDKPFDSEPGTAWRYSNSGFYLAGMIVERVSGQDYGAYLRDHVFKPLGMSSARLCDARMVVPHLASGYERDRDSFVNAPLMSWKLPFSAGSVCATAVDLLKWQTALDQGHFLHASSLKLMRTPVNLTDGTNIDYGLGTRLGSLGGHRVLGHTGSGGGFTAALVSFPDDHLTVVVLINTEAAPALNTAADIARTMLGLPIKKSVADLPVPKEELATLPGAFS